MTNDEPNPRKLYGQRWAYHIGNSEVLVDNAYSLDGWGQERLLLNGEVVQASSGKHRTKQTYGEPWLTNVEESCLVVTLIAKMATIECHASLDDQEIAISEYLEAVWEGFAESWPDASIWRATERQRHGGQFYSLVRRAMRMLGKNAE